MNAKRDDESRRDEEKLRIDPNRVNVSATTNESKKETMDSSSVDEPIQLLVKSPAHWHIVLNRPEKYNAITKSMYERLIDILERAGKDPQVVLLSITGNGKFYSSGTDLADFAQMAVSEVSERRSC